MARTKYYVVWEGRAPGIYDNWDEARAQIDGFPGARYKSYTDLTAATEAFRGNDVAELTALRTLMRRQQGTSSEIVNYEAFPEIRLDALAVDAACAGNPGLMEYRGVWVANGTEEFHLGPLPDGTNNIGEFLALVHGLALLKQRGLTSVPVYTDSRTARSWVNRGTARTTVARTERNARIFELLRRAEAWLGANPPSTRNQILVWDTQRWGEIPADFGRK